MEFLASLSTPLVLILDLGLALLLLWSLACLGASGHTLIVTGSVCLGWLGFLCLVFGGRRLLPAEIGGPAFLAIVCGVVAVVAGLFFGTPLGTAFRRGGQAWMLMPQGMRALFGAAFLTQGALGAMPSVFAILDGVTHIIAAVSALWVAWSLGQGRGGVAGLWLVNLFGLLDIGFVAAGLAFVLLPQMGPYHPVMYAVFFAAPIFISLHLLSLWHLATARRTETEAAGPAAG